MKAATLTKKPLPDVAVVVPVLNRPHQVPRLMDSLTAATPEPHELLFVADEGDHAELKVLKKIGAEFITMPDGTCWAAKVNEGIRNTEAPWILAGADDLAFHPHWFSRAMRWASDDTGIIGTNDICNPRVMTGQHSTHMLIRRDYARLHGTIDQDGVAFHEGYAHEFADDELVQTAMARGVYVHAFDSLVEHLHPMVGKAPDDATYELGRKHTLQSRRLFRQRKKLWLAL